MKTKRLNWEKARNICIVKTLAKLGHFPSSKSEKEAWFLSPLRSETQASFSVSLKKNYWYDFGIGKGGNIIDLISEIKNCSPYEALQYLEGNSSFSFSPVNSFHKKMYGGLAISEIKDIEHPALVQYLKSRNIPLSLARSYCKEIWYILNKKTCFSVGFANHQGGWELRNKFYKNSTSPKSYSFISRSSSILLITEGMFDFLTLAILEEKLVISSDTIILNSLSFLEKIKILIPDHHQVHLYLDNDPAGDKATKELLNQFNIITDKRGSYINFKDLNEKLKNEKRGGNF